MAVLGQTALATSLLLSRGQRRLCGSHRPASGVRRVAGKTEVRLLPVFELAGK
jgi:hypothetical protein